ncbi:MAG: hypothetical protein WAW36_17990 [Methylovulum miyakonense]|uniref:hypothetical protein n=1 Tax=Methylovulum miyakonense TaxID=645578 RepID=UPI003BB79CA1
MRKMIKPFGMLLVLVAGMAYAEAEFDFEELMETIDTNSHNLQDNITNKDANGAIALAKEMQNSFKLVEGYFEKRGDAADAVTDAKRYEDMAAEIVKFVETNDFEAASNKAIEISKACDTACHDTYKPL